MKTITAVLGSPKSVDKSVTAELINKFFLEIKSHVPQVITEIISLSEKNVSMCKGCLTCKKTGKCPIADDIEDIKSQLKKSDIIVFGSPVHISHVSTTFKNFLDRMIVSLHTFEFIGKPCINFVTANGSGEQETKKYMNHMALLFGAIPISTIIKLANDKFNDGNYNKAIERTIGILSGRNRIKPTIMNSLYFMSMKSIILKNDDYFEYEAKLWRERNWDKKGFKKVLDENASSAN